MNLNQRTVEQFERLTIETLFKDKISIRTLFILTSDRYLYQIMNNKVEEWYMVHTDSCLKLKIVKQVTNGKIKKVFFDVGDNQFISIKIYYDVDKDGRDNVSVKLQKNGDRYYAVKDHYLYNMFFDIHRMNN